MDYRAVLILALALAQQDDSHAVVNGKPVALSDVQALAGTLPPELRRNSEEIFRSCGFIDRLASLAEADKLFEQSPYKEQLALSRKSVLAQAELDQFYRKLDLPEGEQKAYYEKHRDDFTTASVQALLIPAEATDKARQIAVQMKSGAVPAALLAQYPSGLTSVRKGDPKVDPAIRDAVFALKPGEVSAPIARSNGVYVIRLEKIAAPNFEEARADVWRTMADARYLAWMEEVRKSVTVTRSN